MNYFSCYWNWGNLILGISMGRIGRPGDWHVTFHLLFLTIGVGNVAGGFVDEEN